MIGHEARLFFHRVHILLCTVGFWCIVEVPGIYLVGQRDAELLMLHSAPQFLLHSFSLPFLRHQLLPVSLSQGASPHRHNSSSIRENLQTSQRLPSIPKGHVSPASTPIPTVAATCASDKP